MVSESQQGKNYREGEFYTIFLKGHLSVIYFYNHDRELSHTLFPFCPPSWPPNTCNRCEAMSQTEIYLAHKFTE